MTFPNYPNKYPFSNLHELNLDWVMETVKKWANACAEIQAEWANINLDEKIKEQLIQLIDDGVFDDDLATLITNTLFVNVKQPPDGLTAAKGDGNTNDTDAVAACIEYAANLPFGGIVYFPAGAYLISSLELKNNVAIVGFSPDNTTLTRYQSARPMFTASAVSVYISGLSVNGKADSATTNDDVFNITGGAITFENVKVRNAYNALVLNTCDSAVIDMRAEQCVNSSLMLQNCTNCKACIFSRDTSATNNEPDVSVSGDGNVITMYSDKATALKITGTRNSAIMHGAGTVDVASGNAVYQDFGTVKNEASTRTDTTSGAHTISAEDVNVDGGASVSVQAPSITADATEQFTASGAGASSLNLGSDAEITSDGNVTVTATEKITNKAAGIVFDSDHVQLGMIESDADGEYVGMFDRADTPYKIRLTTETIETGLYNVQAYGAKGDGVTDDTAAIQAAIDACPIHGTVLIPFTGKSYMTSAQLNVNKPIAIVSTYTGMEFNEHWDGVTEAQLETPVINYSGQSYAVNFTTMGFRIENISIWAPQGGGIGISPVSSAIVTNPRNNVIRNVTVYSASATTNGVQLNNAFRTVLENVFAYGCRYGFNASGGTSLTFINCWAREFAESAFRMANENYCAFINCCADTESTSALVPYYFQGCYGISLIACGCEGSQRNAFGFSNCKGVFLSGFAVSNNKGTTNNGTISFESGTVGTISGFSDNNNYSGQTNASVLVTSDSKVVVEGSKIDDAFVNGVYKAIDGTFWTNGANPWS